MLLFCLLWTLGLSHTAHAQAVIQNAALTPARAESVADDASIGGLSFQSPAPAETDAAVGEANAPSTTGRASADVDVAAHTADGADWAAHFGVPGVPFRELRALAVDANGVVYVCCTSPSFAQFEVLMWTGARWVETGSKFDQEPTALVAHGIDLYAAGPFSKSGGITARGVARWDGQQWARVGSGVGPQLDNFDNPIQGNLNAAAIYQGQLIVAGAFETIDGVSAANIARWDGQAWHPLAEGIGLEEGFNFDQGVYTLAADGDKLYVGGDFIAAGEMVAENIAIWNGMAWNTLGSGIDKGDEYDQVRVTALAAGNGSVYAAGKFSGAGGTDAANIARWNGSAWSPLGDGISSPLVNEIHTLLLLGDTLYAGGKFVYAGGETIPNFARYRGNAWQAVPDAELPEFDAVNALVARPGGGYYIAGAFDKIGGLLAHNVAEYTGQAWDVFGRGLTNTHNGATPGHIYAVIEVEAGRIYAGGRFVTAGGVAVNNIALWDGVRWHPLGEGVTGDGGLDDGSVRALAFYQGELYVGGQFSTAGGAPAKHLAKWNPATQKWGEVGGSVDGAVYALTVGHDRLYVGGNFKTVGALPVHDVAFWNGAAWGAPADSLRIYQVFDNCSEQATHVYALAVWRNMLVVGGDFRLVYAGGDLCAIGSYRGANHILLWDVQQDEWFFAGNEAPYGVGPGAGVFGAPVSALEVVGDDVYVGGGFGMAGGSNVSRLARFNGQGWAEVGGGVSGADNCALCTGPEVLDLLASGPNLYVSGDFLNTGGGPTKNIAVYDTVKQQWASFGGGLDAVAPVKAYSLALAGGGLFVGGVYEQAGSAPATGFSYWNGVEDDWMIGPQGGVLENAGGVKITFPAGAVAEDVRIRYAPLANQSVNLPANLSILNGFRLTAARADDAPVSQFAKSYTLQVNFGSQAVAPDKINLHVRNNGGEWQPMLPCAGCSVDPAAGTVTIAADHFSDFVVTRELEEEEPNPEPNPEPETRKLFIPAAQR